MAQLTNPSLAQLLKYSAQILNKICRPRPRTQKGIRSKKGFWSIPSFFKPKLQSNPSESGPTATARIFLLLLFPSAAYLQTSRLLRVRSPSSAPPPFSDSVGQRRHRQPQHPETPPTKHLSHLSSSPNTIIDLLFSATDAADATSFLKIRRSHTISLSSSPPINRLLCRSIFARFSAVNAASQSASQFSAISADPLPSTAATGSRDK